LLAANFPALTGDVTNTSGSLTTTISNGAITTTKIADGAVTDAKLASGAAIANLGYTPAHAGPNNDITSLSGLTTLLSPAQGGVGGLTGILYGNGASAATAIMPGTGVVSAIEQPVASNAGFSQTFVVTDTRWGTSLCSGVACPIGAGGDDSVPLNAISAACQTAKSCRVIFPPGVLLHVCATPWTLPAVAPISMIIVGDGKAFGGIQILPGCATSLNTVIDLPAITFGNPVVASSAYYEIDNLRVDAYCLAPHDFFQEFSAQPLAGFNFHGSLFRNVTPSITYASFDGGSNILIASSYQNNIDASNSVENENDVGHTCYGAYSAGSTTNIGLFPPFLFDTTGTDSQIGIQGNGASVAGVVAMYGGANRFNRAHPWGLPPTNSLSQPYSFPQYDFLFRGNQILDTGIFDSGINSGVRQQIEPDATGVDRITQVDNAGTGGTPGYVTLTGVSGTGTKFTALGVVGPSGKLTSIPFVTYAGNYSVPPNLTGETLTSTGGLTGVVVDLQMGFGTANTEGSLISHMVGCCSTYNGLTIGAGVTSMSFTNNDMSGLGNSCVVLDSNATMPQQFDGTGNISCNLPYSIPTATGTCPISNAVSSHGIDWISGTFQTATCASGGTIILSTSATNRTQSDGWACSFNTPNASMTSASPTSFTITAGAAGLGSQFVSYNCRGV